MSTHTGTHAIEWLAELTIADGELDRFKELGEQTIASVRANEPGALRYDWHISEDGKTCHVHERYEGTAGAVAHVTGDAVTNLLPKLLEVSEFTGLWVYTEVDDPELREMLSSFGAVFVRPWASL